MRRVKFILLEYDLIEQLTISNDKFNETIKCEEFFPFSFQGRTIGKKRKKERDKRR